MLTLEFQYHSLFILRIRHDYFTSADKAGFSLRPTRQTETFLTKTGCMTRIGEGEIHFLYDANRLEALEMYLGRPETDKLSFWLYADSPYLLNYTNLPSELRNFSLYFQNTQTEKFKETPLHTAEAVSLAEVLPLKSAGFALDTFTQKTEITLENSQAQVVQKATYKANQFGFVELSGLTDGQYTLKENGKVKETFVYRSAQNLDIPLGLVEIHLTEAIKADIRQAIRAEEKIPLYAYKIAFKTRQTYWRYIIIPKYDDSLQNISIETGNNRIAFTGPAPTNILGKSAYLFESESALGLYELSPYRFQLIKNKDSKGKPVHLLLRKLPCAGVEHIKPANRQQDAKVYSEMLVYI
jgi:hypothetical protein